MFPSTSMPDRDWWRSLWPNASDAVEPFGICSEDVVVDLCCGDGFFTAPLVKTAKRVIGIELDNALIEEAKLELSSQHCMDNCDLLVGDAMELRRFVPSEVDVVYLANTFHGIPDKAGLTKAVAGVLRAGGKFILINWHQLPREDTTVFGQPRGPKTELRLSPQQTIDLVTESGAFAVGKTVELPPYHYGIMFYKR